MSDMSSLSHEYASTTDFSHHVNQAVLLLKKRYIGRSDVDPEELAKASQLVSGIVRRLLVRMGREVAEPKAANAVVIPEDVLIRLEEKERGNLEYFMDDLSKLNESISGDSGLTPAEIELLDSICEVADASASATFRKLWRR